MWKLGTNSSGTSSKGSRRQRKALSIWMNIRRDWVSRSIRRCSRTSKLSNERRVGVRQNEMTRLVQIKNGDVRRVALVEEPHLRLLDGCGYVYDLSKAALATGIKLSELVKQRSTKNRLEYDPIYCGRANWQLLPPVDHPEPACCLVSGTGLTHLGSARDRQSMHASAGQDITDSMRMFRWGVE